MTAHLWSIASNTMHVWGKELPNILTITYNYKIICIDKCLKCASEVYHAHGDLLPFNMLCAIRTWLWGTTRPNAPWPMSQFIFNAIVLCTSSNLQLNWYITNATWKALTWSPGHILVIWVVIHHFLLNFGLLLTCLPRDPCFFNVK